MSTRPDIAPEPQWVSDIQGTAKRFGHAVISIDTFNPPFVYTAGLCHADFPELLIFGLDPENAPRIIDYCAQFLMRDHSIVPGQSLSLGGEQSMYAVEANDPRTWTEFVLAPATALGEPKVRVIQLIIPDKNGNFPPLCDEPYSLVPILDTAYQPPAGDKNSKANEKMLDG